MKVQIEDRTYLVTWQHGTPRDNTHKLSRGKHPVDHGWTKCYIWQLLDPKEKVLVAASEAKVYYKDTFCKETGRKESLKKALNEARTPLFTVWEPLLGPEPDHNILMDNGIFNVHDRKLFWDAYRGQKEVVVDFTLSKEESQAFIQFLHEQIEKTPINAPE